MLFALEFDTKQAHNEEFNLFFLSKANNVNLTPLCVRQWGGVIDQRARILRAALMCAQFEICSPCFSQLFKLHQHPSHMFISGSYCFKPKGKADGAQRKVDPHFQIER